MLRFSLFNLSLYTCAHTHTFGCSCYDRRHFIISMKFLHLSFCTYSICILLGLFVCYFHAHVFNFFLSISAWCYWFTLNVYTFLRTNIIQLSKSIYLSLKLSQLRSIIFFLVVDHTVQFRRKQRCGYDDFLPAFRLSIRVESTFTGIRCREAFY